MNSTFKQFLVEQNTQQLAHTNVAEKIIELCQPYLQKGGGVDFDLYRGMSSAYGTSVQIKEVRANRRPMSTSPKLQQVIDQWFYDKFNHPYRSNAIYTSGDIEHAEGYGKPHRIYPIGQFSYVWSPKVDDLFVALGKVEGKLRVAGHRSSILNVDSLYQQHVLEFINQANYMSTGLEQAAESGHETMIAAEKYIAVKESFAQREGLTDQLKEKLQ